MTSVRTRVVAVGTAVRVAVAIRPDSEDDQQHARDYSVLWTRDRLSSERFRWPSHPPEEGLLSRPLLERTFLVGGTLAVLAAAVFRVEIADATLPYAQTAALTTMVVSMALFFGTCRSETRWVLGKHPLSNPLLFVGTLAAVAVHVDVMHFGPTRALLNLEPIALGTWLQIPLVAPSVLVVAELQKYVRGRTADKDGTVDGHGV